MIKLKDDELDKVVGGMIVPDDYYNGMETCNGSLYSSGPNPKYSVGMALKIKYIA